MKHTLKISLMLVALFLVSNLIGLYVIKSYVGQELPLEIEKPELKGSLSYTTIFISVIFATVIALILARFRAFKIWKYWYFLGIIFCLTLAFGAFVGNWGLLIAIALGFYKVFRPNIYIHNLTEIFLYGGLIAYFAESFSVFSAGILLILISIYDWIAVRKIKHMISLVKFQSESKIFAGLLIPYSAPVIKKVGKKTKVKRENAILGGGDIGFPLLFASSVMQEYNLWLGILVSIFAAGSLFYLLYTAEKNKFYPAMPFLTVGCFIGYLVVRLIA